MQSGQTTSHPKARSTRQKAAVNRVLDELEDFVSAQELHTELQQRGEQVSLATVYRLLQQQEEAGALDVLYLEDREAVYRRCAAEEHHHHLVCRVCGATVEVLSPTVENWVTQIAREHGFTHTKHTVEIYGTCADCSAHQ